MGARVGGVGGRGVGVFFFFFWFPNQNIPVKSPPRTCLGKIVFFFFCFFLVGWGGS